MAEHARSIVAENRLGSASGGPITVVSARMEDIASLPVAQVSCGAHLSDHLSLCALHCTEYSVLWVDMLSVH